MYFLLFWDVYLQLFLAASVCMHVLSAINAVIFLSLFYFISIQGDLLLEALKNQNMTAIEQLLKENPNLVNYQGRVRITIKHTMAHIFMCVCSSYTYIHTPTYTYIDTYPHPINPYLQTHRENLSFAYPPPLCLCLYVIVVGEDCITLCSS